MRMPGGAHPYRLQMPAPLTVEEEALARAEMLLPSRAGLCLLGVPNGTLAGDAVTMMAAPILWIINKHAM